MTSRVRSCSLSSATIRFGTADGRRRCRRWRARPQQTRAPPRSRRCHPQVGHQRVLPERALASRRRISFLPVRSHQRGVDVDEHLLVALPRRSFLNPDPDPDPGAGTGAGTGTGLGVRPADHGQRGGQVGGQHINEPADRRVGGNWPDQREPARTSATSAGQSPPAANAIARSIPPVVCARAPTPRTSQRPVHKPGRSEPAAGPRPSTRCPWPGRGPGP